MRAMKPSCAKCKFSFEGEGVMACRRYPPAVYEVAQQGGAAIRSQFPIVRVDFYCGEFRRRLR
jgi:hypothetical protein